MKKSILILVVLALVATGAFAQWTGEFTYRAITDFENNALENSTDNSTEISLTTAISESAEISASIEGGQNSDGDDVMLWNALTLTQDITKALGVDSFGFKFKFGSFKYEPIEYYDVAGYADAVDLTESGTFLGIQLTLMVSDAVNVDFFIHPETWLDTAGNTDQGGDSVGAALYGTVGGFDYNAYWVGETKDNTKSINGYTAIGFNYGLTLGAFKNGLVLEYQALDDDPTNIDSDGNQVDWDLPFGLSFAYDVTDALTLGLAMGASASSGTFRKPQDNSDVTLLDTSKFDLNANYKLNDNANVFGAIGYKIWDETATAVEGKLTFEIGADYNLDGVTYTLAYADTSDFKAYTGDIVKKGLVFKVSAAF